MAFGLIGKFAAAPRSGGSARAAITYILHEELAGKIAHAQWNDPIQPGQRVHVSALMDEARSMPAFGAGEIWRPQSGDRTRPTAILARGVASLQTCAAEMEGVARMSPRTKQPVCHVIVSLNEDESKTVSDEQLIRAAEFAIDRAGFKDHQAVFATHNDTNQKHCHIAIGAVNARTGHAWNRADNYKRLHWALRESELAFGMQHDRGMAVVRDRGLPTQRVDWADRKTRQAFAREREGERLEDMARSFLAESDGLEAPEDRRDRIVYALREYLADCGAREEKPLRADLHAIAARLTATLEQGKDGALNVRLMERAPEGTLARAGTDSHGDPVQRFARWQATDTVFTVAPELIAPSPLDAVKPGGSTTKHERAEHAAALKRRAWLADLGTVARAEEEVVSVVRSDPARISRDLVAAGAATFTSESVDEWCSQRVTEDWMQLSDFAMRSDPTIAILSADTEMNLLTTAAQQQLEQTVFERATRLAQQMDPLFDRAALERAIAGEEKDLGVTFRAEQLAVCELLQYRFALVQGDAGTGKTLLQSVQRRYCEETGREIAGFATSQLASETLGEKAGIRALNTARAQVLEEARGEKMIRPNSRNIFDESSMISLESVAAALERVEKQRASAVFVLDTAQLGNLGAGDTGRVLTQVAKANNRYAEVTQVYRQTGPEVAWMRTAVPLGGRAIREGDADGFRAYLQEFVDRGHVVVHDDRKAEIAAKAADIVAAVRRGEKVLAPSYSRQDCLHTNRAVRRELGLEGTGLSFRVSRGVREFAPGDRVVFERNAEARYGVLNGYLGTVQSVARHEIAVELDGGRTVKVDPAAYPHLEYAWSCSTFKAQGQGDPLVVPTLGRSDDARSAHVALTRCETGLRVHTRLSTDELLDHLTSPAALRPKDDVLLFAEIVQRTGGPETFWARSVRDAMARDTGPLRDEHRTEMARRTQAHEREIRDILTRYQAARESAKPADLPKIERREKRELRAASERYAPESFVVWAAKNKSTIEQSAEERAERQNVRHERAEAQRRTVERVQREAEVRRAAAERVKTLERAQKVEPRRGMRR